MRRVASNGLLRRVSAIFRKEDGAVTVEGVLWLPVYGFFFALIADTSLMFNGQAQAQRVIQDVNRLASTGFYRTEAEIEDRTEAVLSHLTTSPTVKSYIDTTNSLVSTYVIIPASDLMAVGLISKFANVDITIVAQHVIEG